MSNSKLVSYTRISPNRTSPRRHKIDTITPHMVVGQLSVETIGSIFAPKARQASSNYGIGYDGRVGLYVPESDRSWCSSSPTNDHRAVTIECASDLTPPYAINGRVYDSLIKLCADICKRNEIKSMKWRADPTLIGDIARQNVTVHKWFANTACPGEYLYSKLGKIANDVNQLIGSSVINVESAKKSAPAKKYEREKLRVDGRGGFQTNVQTQLLLGTPVDGTVSSQSAYSSKFWTGGALILSVWLVVANPKGSTMIRALQAHIGMPARERDGLFGPATITRLQVFLSSRGYYKGRIDSLCGPMTVEAWQKYVNSKIK